jgi:uncharacterized protein
LSFQADLKAVKDTSTGEFEGYGSVFGVVDSYNEIVDKGAFVESLNGKMPMLLWQHDTRQPIGIYTEAREDERGLYLRGQLNLDVQTGREAYSLLKQGALKGMSIGFRVLSDESDRTSGLTHLKKLDLWEVSLVSFPANDKATVGQVKANTIRDFEEFLREAGGYSREEAKIIASHGYSTLEARREGGDEAALAAKLQSLATLINGSPLCGTH